MLFWIFVIAFFVFLIIGLIVKYRRRHRIYNDMPLFCIMGIGFCGMILFFMIAIIIFSHASAPANLHEFENYRTSIDAKIESGLYSDEFGIMDKEIINEIRYYNKCVIQKKMFIGNFWIGIFVPDCYSELELIDYNIVPARDVEV